MGNCMLNNDFVKAAELFKKYAIVGQSNTSAQMAKEYICKKIPDDLLHMGINEPIYKIKGTVGQGRTVEVPWVAIMRRKITTSTTRGLYIVYLFSADMKRLYLSFMLGCAYFSKKGINKRSEIRKIAKELSKMVTIPDRFSTDPIMLGGKYVTNKEYESAHIFGIEYSLDKMPSSKQMQDDVYDMLSVYDQVVSMIGERTIDEFYDYVDATADGLVVDNEYRFSTDTVDDWNNNTSSGYTIDDQPEEKRKAVRNHKGEMKYPRNEGKAKKALEYANYKCEYDSSHFSFHSKKNKLRMYVEAHHLIPLNKYESFDNSLDVESNIVSLCPNCHRCIHNGIKSERDAIVTKLFNERKDRLNKSNIDISLDKLLDFIK